MWFRRNRKRHGQDGISKTEIPCSCGWLEREADEPDSPVVFDKQMGEYQMVSASGNRTSVLYHCPFCGGKAPESRRSNFFATLTASEIERLQALVAGLRTIEEVLARFGPPDEDFSAGSGTMTPGKNGRPDRFESLRMLHYEGLSDTAMVHVEVSASGHVGFSYTGKYLSAPEQN
jgi:hypothetical protein